MGAEDTDDEDRLVLIPRFTTLTGNDESPMTYTTPPKDVSSLASADFLLFRGPIMTASPFRAICRVTLEDSPDKVHWIRCSNEQECSTADEEHVETFQQFFRLQWLRARVDFEGQSVSCSLEGETRPRA